MRRPASVAKRMDDCRAIGTRFRCCVVTVLLLCSSEILRFEIEIDHDSELLKDVFSAYSLFCFSVES